MSVRAIGWALDQPIPQSGAKFVLVALANYADDQGRCWPAVETLADDTSQGTSTVRRHLTALEASGYITRIPQYKNNKQINNVYRLAYPLKSRGDSPMPSQIERDPPLKSRPTPLSNRETEPSLKNRQEEPSTSLAAAPQKTSRVDPVWDTLVELHGFAPTPKTPEHGRWNKACAIYRAIGATPDQVRAAHRAYLKKYPGMDSNAIAVANRAEALLAETTQGGTRHAAAVRQSAELSPYEAAEAERRVRLYAAANARHAALVAAQSDYAGEPFDLS